MDFKPGQLVFVLITEEVYEAYHNSHIEHLLHLGKVKEELHGSWLGNQRRFRVHILGRVGPYSVEQVDIEDLKPYHEDWIGKRWEEL